LILFRGVLESLLFSFRFSLMGGRGGHFFLTKFSDNEPSAPSQSGVSNSLTPPPHAHRQLLSTNQPNQTKINQPIPKTKVTGETMSSPNENNPPNLQTPTSSFHTKQQQQVSSPFILPTTPATPLHQHQHTPQQQKQQQDDGDHTNQDRETKVKYIWGTNIRVQKAATVTLLHRVCWIGKRKKLTKEIQRHSCRS